MKIQIKSRIVFGFVFLFLALFMFWGLISVLIDQKDPIPFVGFLTNKGVDLKLFFLSLGILSLVAMFDFFLKKNVLEIVPVGLITITSILLFFIAIS